MKNTIVFLSLFGAGYILGAFQYKGALDSCLGEVSGKSRDLISHVGALERENSYLRRSVDLLTEHLLDCERDQSLGCVRGSYYPDGQ